MISYNRSSLIPFATAACLFVIVLGLLTHSKTGENRFLMALVLLISALVFTGWGIFIRRQAPALVIGEQGVELRPTMFGPRSNFSWEDIVSIQYVVRQSEGLQYVILKKDFLFYGANRQFLISMPVGKLAEFDFNDVYHFIQEQAPHVTWEFADDVQFY
ncbi:TPA: hypothetical protein TXJ16_000679 [Streptococcus suis]|uniref:Uncharacterized protein n=1 Tax=Streptococcus suivaginalis TaxID=3028082 RepID=A0AA96VB01_9STRE|nr:hypothetical protein [Streptococcus sp. 29896]MCK4027962.1 hypothetical protein [Streptococcus suis]WNY46417.1 hypothetical protein PXH68_05845 [Streptococcus sp. 29896]HEL1586178.1 hypothetical protein [Streptococcus suis]